MFSTRTEKPGSLNIPEQITLSDLAGGEAEKQAFSAPEPPKPTEKLTVDSYTRNKGSRDKKRTQEELLENVIHGDPEYIYASDDERVCPACGSEMAHLGWEKVRTEVRVIPEQIYATDIYMEKLYCPKCKEDDDVFVTASASAPPAIIPGSYPSDSLLSFIACQKYQLCVPTYRLEHYLLLWGVSIPRGRMSRWLITIAEKYLFIIYERLHTEMKKHRDIINIDETPCPVNKIEELVPLADENGLPLSEEETARLTKERDARAAAAEGEPDDVSQDGKNEVPMAKRKKCFMWLYAAKYGTDHPIILYDYEPSRAGYNWKNFLGMDYEGYIITDGWSAYNTDEKHQSDTDHIRRKWFYAIRNKEGPLDMKDPAVEGFCRINEIYMIERKLKNKAPVKRKEERLKQEKPRWDSFKTWMDSLDPSGGTSLQVAVNYTQKQWTRAMTYLEDGRMPMWNNEAERCAKSYATVRKNALFHDTSRGARSAAILKSLIDTAAANHLNPELYLSELLKSARDYVEEPARAAEYLPWTEKMQGLCANRAELKDGPHQEPSGSAHQ